MLSPCIRLSAAAFAAFLVPAASAAIITFNDSSIFAAFAASNGAAVATEGFDGVSGTAPSYTGNLQGVQWLATADSGVFAANGILSSASSPSALRFTLSPGVQGVGGNFFATNAGQVFQPSSIYMTLSNGKGFYGTISSPSQFTGFWSTGASISSISIELLPNLGGFASADSLSVAVVPGPGAVALLGAAGLLAGGRRRRD